jgi:hypothetical protein
MFKSFFFAGFECATGYNEKGEWIDQISATWHDQHADEDYRRLKEVGMHATREAIRWPLVDRGNGEYDFSSVKPFVEAARKHGVQVIWDLFHYGYPEGVDLFSEAFAERFAAYCKACIKYICENLDGPVFVTPVNEPSYYSWAAAEVGKFAPHEKGRGFELKYSLCRAAIRGIDAIWEVCPDARIVNADPLCYVVPQLGKPEMQPDCDGFNNIAVFQSWDMLCGKLHPELGGSRKHLDIIGINYYWTNQWELGTDHGPLADDDPRRVPLRKLIKSVHERYGGELMISETSHVNEHRSRWIMEVAHEAEAVLEAGVPLLGVCLYPILGMPEWHAQDEWTRLGLWDVCEKTKRRNVYKPMLHALRSAQRLDHGHHVRRMRLKRPQS